MIKIQKLNNGFKVEGIDNVLYPDNGTLVFGPNTVILVTDESDMVTFRSASNFDVLFSGLIQNITIDGENVTKDNIVEKFQAIANDDVSEQLTNYETIANHNADKALLEASIALKANSADLLTLFDYAEYNSQTKKIVFKHGDTVLVQIDATDFIKDGMVSNVEIVDNKLVISFNTDSGKENIEIPLSEIFNPNDYYTKAQIDTKEQSVNASIALKANSADLATVATSGSYNDLNDKPTFPDTSEFVTKTEYKPKELAIAEALTNLNENKADKTEIPDVSTFATKTELNAKQDALVSGTNIKTINNQSILGEGNIEIQGGAGEQQQADWNQTNTTAVDYIKNKPTNVSDFANDAGYLTQHQRLTDYYTKTEIDAMVGRINTILASI